MLKACGKSVLYEVFNSLLNKPAIQKRAKELKIVQRERDVCILGVIRAFLSVCCEGELKSIEHVRRTYNFQQGQNISKAAFYERLTPELAELMVEIFETACKEYQIPTEKSASFKAGIKRIFSMDSTDITLEDKLKDMFPSSNYARGRNGSKKASVLKIHLGYDALAPVPETISITPKTTNDVTQFEAGPWCEKTLVLYDRGYFSFVDFSEIINNGGDFVTRYKAKGKSCIVKDNIRPKFNGEIGLRIDDVLTDELKSGCPRAFLDYELRVQGEYQKNKVAHKLDFNIRFVGIYQKEKGIYYTYLTSLPPSRANASLVADFYRCRWGIEIEFKVMKSSFKIGQVNTGKAEIATLLIYSSLLCWLLCRIVRLKLLSQSKCQAREAPPLLFSKVFCKIMPDALQAIEQKDRKRLKFLQEFLINEMKTPYKMRKQAIHDLVTIEKEAA